MATPTERAEARAQEEARAHARPLRLTRAEVERVLASVPAESELVLRRMIARHPGTRVPGYVEEYQATNALLGALADGLA